MGLQPENEALLDAIYATAAGRSPWGGLDRPNLHFAFAPRVYYRLQEADEDLPTAVLDALDSPLCVVDAGARLVYANAPGTRLLRAGEVLARLRGGRLRACGGRCDAALRQAIADALQGRAGGVQLMDRGGAPSYNLAALRLRPAGPAGAARVLLVMSAVHRQRAPAAQLLQRMFGLTQAEASLALALAQGQKAEDYAMRTRRSLATIRTQMRALYAKTGAGRLGDLLLQLGRIPPV